MKIWTISDTHGKHGFLDIPLDSIDVVIRAGDMGTMREPILNTNIVLDTLTWLDSLKHIPYKIVIAGNHDTSIEHGLVKVKEQFPELIYLKHESITIEGINIFGSPYTPTFGTGWAFNVNRDKLHDYWEMIPDNTDILITHGPPRGILDTTYVNLHSSRNESLYAHCGDTALYNVVTKMIQPKYHIFGHIHTEHNCPNAGIMEIQGCTTKFINASVVDLQYNLCNNGYIIEI